MAEEDKTEENRVKGCQATVWLKSQTDDQTPPCLSFVADSNSQIVKGLVYILHLMFSGKSISEIIAYDEKAIFSRLGFGSALKSDSKHGSQCDGSADQSSGPLSWVVDRKCGVVP